MSYQARERKRRKKEKESVAIESMRSARSASRSSVSATTASKGKFWLTIVKKRTCCARCGLVLKVGAEMVFRYAPRESLCQPCAIDAKVRFRPSTRWVRERRR